MKYNNMGGIINPSNLLDRPKSQREVLDRITSISRVDQENYIKATLQGGCVQTTFDQNKCQYVFKYISKLEMIKPLSKEDKLTITQID